jgi:hypothetical protein
MAVEACHHRRHFARDVDQDRRGGPPVLGPVVDARQHDQRADRVYAEGDRQQHGDGGDGPHARQHANQGADQAAEEAQGDVLERERDTHAQREIVAQIGCEVGEEIHSSCPSANEQVLDDAEPWPIADVQAVGTIDRVGDQAGGIEGDWQVEQLLEQDTAQQGHQH